MEKLLRTTYRKLFGMCRRVDRSTALRSSLVCAPLTMFDHNIGEWTQLEWSKVAPMPESELLLDHLIRRLNNGRQYYIPPTPDELAEVATRALRQQRVSSGAAVKTRLSMTVHGTSVTAEVTSKPQSNTASNKTATEDRSASMAAIATMVQPYSPLCTTAHQLFERTPFSIGKLNDAFAAVKLLSYVCAAATRNTPRLRTVPAALRARLPAPLFRRVRYPQTVEGVFSAQGVTDELRRSLRVTIEQAAASATETAATPSLAAATTATATEPPSVAAAAAAAANDAAAAATPTSPTTLQLLLAHPMLNGFFTRTVQLVVCHTENEASSFVLNKPLMNDKGVYMPVHATIRLSRVHTIYRRYLSEHILMVGGPVMVNGTFDESLFLLHRVPGVRGATQVAASLWLDGDLDVLMSKLESKEAAPEDIIVLCGFAGWGRGQLKGELDAGTWVVASTAADDPAASDFVLTVARASAKGLAAVVPHGADDAAGVAAEDCEVTKPEEAATTTTTAKAHDESDSARSGREHASRHSVRLWSWAYELLGEPYAGLGRNQVAEHHEHTN